VVREVVEGNGKGRAFWEMKNRGFITSIKKWEEGEAACLSFSLFCFPSVGSAD
jgi:hypothetical protein